MNDSNNVGSEGKAFDFPKALTAGLKATGSELAKQGGNLALPGIWKWVSAVIWAPLAAAVPLGAAWAWSKDNWPLTMSIVCGFLLLVSAARAIWLDRKERRGLDELKAGLLAGNDTRRRFFRIQRADIVVPHNSATPYRVEVEIESPEPIELEADTLSMVLTRRDSGETLTLGQNEAHFRIEGSRIVALCRNRSANVQAMADVIKEKGVSVGVRLRFSSNSAEDAVTTGLQYSED